METRASFRGGPREDDSGPVSVVAANPGLTDGASGNPDCRFPRREKLKGRTEIRELFNRGRNVSCPGAKLFTLRNGLPYNRIAFTFSRKFGNAVERNHSRRLSREVYRILRSKLGKGYDLVLLVYPGKDVFSVRTEQLRELFSRAGLLKPSPEGSSRGYNPKGRDPKDRAPPERNSGSLEQKVPDGKKST